MGWRGTDNGPNTGAANMYGVFLGFHIAPNDWKLTVHSGDYFFIRGPLLLIAGLLEFFLGNTFTFVVFISYGKSEPMLDLRMSGFKSLLLTNALFFHSGHLLHPCGQFPAVLQCRRRIFRERFRQCCWSSNAGLQRKFR
jgi:hypothetical protein